LKQTTLAVSLGCPSGIGPEVTVLAAASAPPDVRCVLVGDDMVVRRAAHLRNVDPNRFRRVHDADSIETLEARQIGIWQPSTQLQLPSRFGLPDQDAGRGQLAWVNEALAMVQAGIAQAMVTGPVSKHAIATSGAPGAASFLGHTEHLARALHAEEVVMSFVTANITTSLVTTHLPISKVPKAITKQAVSCSTYWLVRLLRALGKARPRVAVASLNPHAGEGGLLGKEEETSIRPGIALVVERLDREGIAAEILGPIGAETAYRKNDAGLFDGVVAMYHDQATIPSKLVGFGDAVNVTLGLPVIRTSVDHGTGYDIAGKVLADPRSMASAIALALKLTRSRKEASLLWRPSGRPSGNRG